MTRTRLPGVQRRGQIVAAARRVFSQHGYDGAKTLQIAREAKVSEALVFRHFPSKLALYRAVLRQVFLEQDERWREQGVHGEGARGLASAIHTFISACATDADDPARHDTHRMTLASLAGDGSYASLIYRRSQRRHGAAMDAAYASARAEGGLEGEPLDVPAAAMFVEHVGTMMAAIGGLPLAARPYGIAGDDLVRQATWFCLRGIGMPDRIIADYFASLASDT
ncbi:TetR/AcrR family transcriptional regulator [Novosphingobium subterraneum]|uniref:Bacterial regulatory protein, tetR family n=1 Tax=Novosphingobium subterraneum TaxID=48936 RepID=A0A0B9A632_9SPHN|nr:TetR/AcrR family transcriptional regulator [Novosphingobium subterraneum]KHS46059.1 Bacterial regulatory protein, tetR family [Novosphingobium subterraneum]